MMTKEKIENKLFWHYLSGILWLSSNMCETDKKGLTELSEINLVRPFSSAFILRFLDSCNATGHILPE